MSVHSRVLTLLAADTGVSARHSPDGRTALLFSHAAHPPAGAPSDACPVRLAGPDGGLRPVPGLWLRPTVCAWSPDGSTVAGQRTDGSAIVLDTATGAVTELNGRGRPLGWAGAGLLVVSVPEPPEPEPPGADAPWIYEAAPGTRVRLAADPPPAALWTIDLHTLDRRRLPVPPGAYTRARWSRETGRLALGTPVGLTILEPHGSCTELTGPIADFTWSGTGRLILLESHRTQVGLSGEDRGSQGWWPARRLWSQPDPNGLWVLIRERSGLRLVLATAGRSIRTWRLRGQRRGSLRLIAPPCPGTDPLRLVVTDRTGISLLQQTEPGTLTAVHRLRLPDNAAFVRVGDWHTGTIRIASPAGELASLHPGSPVRRRRAPRSRIDLGDPTGTGRTRLTLQPPRRTDRPFATVVELSGGLALPASSAVPRPRPLAHCGYAVATLHLALPWWPGTPDEDIRPRLCELITTAVTRLGDHVDATRLTVHGHSFGATLALIALADTALFACATAISGAYCRSWTPLGFQHETRTLWEAPSLYHDFDAIRCASRICRPVLLLHGREDANPATPVDHATLLFRSLTALGTPCRLVILPGEGHSLRSREAAATALAEEAAWVDRWARGDG